eukprot:CAMPEP_0168573886 /NCGR_PEP_ID=MMETSP0413-20121227/18779_1 /TAXON_ID=136452 /ORGANISM="Filamoeba nolandi, Strain NC-AS-23-1" /LENGTH=312 /DNA_ID=CAMNT_0008607177 /DNA_START=21 /DNA_END=956 /DNA_ORIENTATION=-
MEQWYSVDTKDLSTRGGEHLLLLHGRSMLQALYPNYEWLPWKFPKLPKGYWNNMDNQKKFFEWLRHPSRLNIPSLEDWYKVSVEDVAKQGGYFLLQTHYHYSLGKALRAVYPEHPWRLWRFERVPRGFWSDQANILAFFQYCTQQFSITHLSDWLTVETQLIRKAGGTTLLSKFGGFVPLLQHVYPGFNWNAVAKRITVTDRDSRFESKAERHLTRHVQKLLPNVKLVKNYRDKELFYKFTNRWMEFDIFLPAIEYHGEQHYQKTFLFGSEVYQQQRDADKRDLCKERGITLIEIPFWWDRSIESLAATLHQ